MKTQARKRLAQFLFVPILFYFLSTWSGWIDLFPTRLDQVIHLFFLTVWGFLAAVQAKTLYQAGKLNTFWLTMVFPLVFLFLWLDFFFNLVFSWTFLRGPKAILFSGTVQWHVRHSSGWRLQYAYWWAENLNIPDPDHIHV